MSKKQKYSDEATSFQVLGKLQLYFDQSPQLSFGAMNPQSPSLHEDFPMFGVSPFPISIKKEQICYSQVIDTVRQGKNLDSQQAQYQLKPNSEMIKKRVDNYMMKKPNLILSKVLKRLGIQEHKTKYPQLKRHQTSYFVMLLCILEKNLSLQKGLEIFQDQVKLEIAKAKANKKNDIIKYLDNAHEAFLAFLNQDYYQAMNIIYFSKNGLVKNKILQIAKSKMDIFRKELKK